MEADSEARKRIEAIRRRWRWSARLRSIRTAAVCAVLVTSYAVGYSFGPSPIRYPELVTAGILALLGVGWMSVRRDAWPQRKAAQERWRVREGERSRRVLVFDTYVLVDDEILLLSVIETVRREGDRLVVRYRDVEVSGPRLREWTGHPEVLDSLSRVLQGQPVGVE